MSLRDDVVYEGETRSPGEDQAEALLSCVLEYSLLTRCCKLWLMSDSASASASHVPGGT
jgi:hypothetical protein